MSAPEISFTEVARIELRTCEMQGRRWIEQSLFDASGEKIAEIALWHPDNDKVPDVKVV